MHEYIYDLIGKRVPKQEKCKIRKDGNHYLVLGHDKGGLVVSLNRTSGEVFNSCDGIRTVEDIAKIMHGKYSSVDYANIKRDVIRCVRDLEAMVLVSVIN